MLESKLASNWGWVVARGVAAILFGFFALAQPGITLMSLLTVFAVFLFFEGIANVMSAVRGGRAGETHWGTLLIEGLLSIGIAVLAVLSPARMALALVFVMGVWAVLGGALRIGAAIRLRKVIEHEWVLGLSGLFAIAFGIFLLFRPVVGTLALVWWLGAFAIVEGIMLTVVGIRLRHVAHHLPGGGRRELPTGGLHEAR
jgi:uncharacterized membrane protein HdeD (DUF308 family)